MEKPKKEPVDYLSFFHTVACRMHIYDTFQETLIKTLLFLIAFLISVLPLFINISEKPEGMNLQDDSPSSTIATEDNITEPTETGSDAVGSTDADSYIAAGGALIVYGISLIAEICMLLTPNDFLSKKLLKGSILFIGIMMMVFGFVQVFIPPLTVSPNTVTVFGSFSVVIYVIDTVTFYLVKPSIKYPSDGLETKLKDIYVGA